MLSFLIGSFYGKITFIRDCRATGYSEVLTTYLVCDVWFKHEKEQAEQQPEEIYMRYNF